jgi:hypothetical protein
VYCPIDNLLVFVYVLREFALVGNFEEDLITSTIGEQEKRRPKNNTHQQRRLDISHLALEHRKPTQDGDHIAKIVLPAWYVARLQQAGAKFGYRQLVSTGHPI